MFDFLAVVTILVNADQKDCTGVGMSSGRSTHKVNLVHVTHDCAIAPIIDKVMPLTSSDIGVEV